LRAAVRTHWRSRVALGLALLHAVVFDAVIFGEAPLSPPRADACASVEADETCVDISPWHFGTGAIIAGRYFHQDPGFWFLTLADLPAVVLASLVGAALDASSSVVGVRPSIVAATYIYGGLWLAFATVQWWLIGILVKARWARRTV
jgi:hypothetical protein